MLVLEARPKFKSSSVDQDNYLDMDTNTGVQNYACNWQIISGHVKSRYDLTKSGHTIAGNNSRNISTRFTASAVPLNRQRHLRVAFNCIIIYHR